MEVVDIVNVVFRIVEVVVAPLLGWGVKVLADIRGELRILNGRVIRAETNIEGHNARLRLLERRA